MSEMLVMKRERCLTLVSVSRQKESRREEMMVAYARRMSGMAWVIEIL